MLTTERVVLLIDMDCFYCQVEEKLQPNLAGKPIAVVQYNDWRGGGIIAVNYVAKDRGVTRHMRGDEAKKKCPDIELVRVPVLRGKADLTKYRNAGKEVANVLLKFTENLERASVDEAYLDITKNVEERMHSTEVMTEFLKNTHVVGCSIEDFLENAYSDLSKDNLKLAIGGVISEEIRTAVYKETSYRCSAGIAHNKILAKLACGLHKPNQQTILPQDRVPEFFDTLPINKIRNLGGKFGDAVAEDLKIETVGELTKFSKEELIKRYDEKSGKFLYDIARGIDLEPVTTRLISKSIGCCKRFPGKTALRDEETVKKWLHELSSELLERLEIDHEENNRKAKGLTISFWNSNGKRSVSGSRVQVLTAYDIDKIMCDAYQVIKKNCMKPDGSYHINFLGLSASKFESSKNNNMDIKSFFTAEHFNRANSLRKPEEDSTCINNVFMESKKPHFTQQNSGCTSKNKCTRELNATVTKEQNKNLESEEILLSNIKNLITTNSNTQNNSSSQKEKEFNDSDDSVNNELAEILHISKNNPHIDFEEGKGSFFNKYFRAFKDEKETERNFNTSYCLENDSSQDDFLEDIDSYDATDENYVAVAIEAASKAVEFQNTSNSKDNSTEVCQKCGEKISIADLVSHMDFHLALEIAQEERHMNSNDNINNKGFKTFSGKTNKRKTSETDKNISITKYLKQIDNQENSKISSEQKELCVQCNKLIPVSELESHMDYHVAKRIHLEINSIKPTIHATAHKILNKNGKLKEQKSKHPSVISFFKQSS